MFLSRPSGVLERVLYEAKAIYTNEGLASKLVLANSYLAYVKVSGDSYYL